MKLTRRHFLGAAGAGLATTYALLDGLPSVAAAETIISPERVQFTGDIEPIVRLIETTPRTEAVEVLAREIKGGLDYQAFLAAMFLAGIRNVNPQPPGFKLHCVFMIHSANYLAQMAPPEERLLPLFYALDEFKVSQKADIHTGDFVLPPPATVLPEPAVAWEAFRRSMDEWDSEGADSAITALARHEKPEQLFEGLWEYGARDYRNIGHKMIFTAHAWRTLQSIGWQHAEPTLRSLVLALLDYGQSGVYSGYAFEDQSFVYNRTQTERRHARLPEGWTQHSPNAGLTLELLSVLRESDAEAASDFALNALSEGRCDSGSIWDSAHLAASEMMMRQPAITAVHAVTSINSLHYGFRTTTSDKTKLLLLLQALGWMTQFRKFLDESMFSRRTRDVRLTDLSEGILPQSEAGAVESIVELISEDKDEAARLAFAYGKKYSDPANFFDAARQLVFKKSVEHHHLKWPAAVFEDFYQVSPQWRPHMLATSVFFLRGPGHRNSTVVERAVKSLAG